MSSPETTVTALSVTSSDGTFVFTVTVAGDGQAMAESENTQWYNPRFTVETADGGFIIDGNWAQGRDFRGAGLDSDFNAVPGAVVTAEWTGPNTFRTTASNLGVTGEVESGLIEFSVRLLNPDGTNGATSEGDYTWGS